MKRKKLSRWREWSEEKEVDAADREVKERRVLEWSPLLPVCALLSFKNGEELRKEREVQNMSPKFLGVFLCKNIYFKLLSNEAYI